MKAIILNHPKDIKLFNRFDKKINFYAYNYYTYLTLKKKIKNIYYINDSIFLKKLDNFSLDIPLNWFRKNRNNNLKKKKISIGNIVLPRLQEEFSNSVKNYLISLGISSDRVSTISYGKERPAVIGSNDGAWAQNRRSVTIVN